MKISILIINSVLAFIIGAFVCDSKADEPLVRINPAPEDHAWWTRIEFRPAQVTIRGIPVNKLDSSWRYASELSKNVIPRNLLFDGGSDNMADRHAAFVLSGDFNRDGIQDLALVGVYENKEGKRGGFLLIVSKSQGGWKKIFLQSWPGMTGFAALALSHKGDNLLHLDCMDCDGVIELAWDKAARKFYWVEYPEEE